MIHDSYRYGDGHLFTHSLCWNTGIVLYDIHSNVDTQRPNITGTFQQFGKILVDTKIKQLYWFLSLLCMYFFGYISNQRVLLFECGLYESRTEWKKKQRHQNFICVSFLVELINFLLQSMEFVRIGAYLWPNNSAKGCDCWLVFFPHILYHLPLRSDKMTYFAFTHIAIESLFGCGEPCEQ